MSNEREDLARRAVACKHWRWMPGMITRHGRICGAGYLVSDDVDEVGQPYVDCTDTIDDWPNLLPDLDDPATLGCLLALVRAAWDDPYVYLEPADSDTPGWLVMMGWLPETATVCSDGSTEAAALIAALEAAP